MKEIKILILFFFIILFNTASNAQFGLDARYQKSDYKGWNDVLRDYSGDTHEVFRNSFHLGIDYGFSLPLYRITFFPGISYGWSEFSFEEDQFIYDLDLTQYSFSVKTHIYPLDLLSKRDMQCPSFYKGGEIFTKGWFIQLTPTLIYSDKVLLLSEKNGLIDYQPVDDSGLIFSFSMGTGMDIGISDNFSISPYIRYSFQIGENWQGFSEVFDEASFNDGSSVSSIDAGIRFGFWFN